MALVVGELSVGPPLGADPVGQMRLRIQSKKTNVEKGKDSVHKKTFLNEQHVVESIHMTDAY